jgi:hypothetical protein
VPVAEAELPWSEELLRLLGRLARDASDADARLRVGTILRRFLEQLGWHVPEKRLARTASESEGPLVLTIHSAAAELYALPWELATLPIANQHLVDVDNVLVRYAWPGAPPLPIGGGVPIGSAAPRVVFAWSTAGGAVPAHEHLAMIQAAISRTSRREAKLVVVPDVTERALESALAETAPTVLHLLCHGIILRDRDGCSAALHWNADTPERTPCEMDPHRLATLLRRAPSPISLVTLCACYGGHAGPDGLVLGSVAQAIHRAGVPAVLASRYPLSAEGSIRLTRVLYEALLAEGMSLEEALQRARAALHSAAGRVSRDGIGDDLGRCSCNRSGGVDSLPSGRRMIAIGSRRWLSRSCTPTSPAILCAGTDSFEVRGSCRSSIIPRSCASWNPMGRIAVGTTS